jgi:hypothetical protein
MSSFIKDILLPLSNILLAETKCDKKIVVKCITNSIEAFLGLEEEKKTEKEEKKTKKEKKIRCESKENEKDEEKICAYIFVRSPKKGQKCSARIDKKSEHFCSKHIKKLDEKDENKTVKKVNKKPVEKIKTEKTKAMIHLKEALKNFIDDKKTTKIKIERNKYGNYECIDKNMRGLLVDPISLEVLGVQDESGRINELTREHIDLCKEKHLLYKIPLNLSQNHDDKKEVEEKKDIEDFEEDIEDYEEDMSDMSDIEG